jgi:hypothetical protein
MLTEKMFVNLRLLVVQTCVSVDRKCQSLVRGAKVRHARTAQPTPSGSATSSVVPGTAGASSGNADALPGALPGPGAAPTNAPNVAVRETEPRWGSGPVGTLLGPSVEHVVLSWPCHLYPLSPAQGNPTTRLIVRCGRSPLDLSGGA